MKPQPSRTISQLHFEDLDPHRFEDLVRQLVYTFRSWTVLEPLGRSGADDGVDIRGIEEVRPASNSDEEVSDSNEELGPQRVWFIQCKRERTLGPSKARAIASAALDVAKDPPHGFILAAPSDLSKRTRETLAAVLHAAGVRQVIAWGRADLEDMLFLPEHDHLLFAYFGISLQVRRRNRTTELRGRLAKKRQIYKAIGDLGHRGLTPVLVRDPDESAYPFRERVENFNHNDPPWIWTAFRHHSNPDTLPLVIRRHHAWISKNRKRFEVVDSCSHVIPGRHGFEKLPQTDEDQCERLWRFFYNAVPPDERAWLEVVGWIPYEDILLVDDLGDVFNEPPHVLVNRGHEYGFFAHVRSFLQLDRDHDQPHLDPETLRRGRLFPNPIPDVEWGTS